MSVRGIAKNHLQYVRVYQVFKDLQRRLQNLPCLPTLLFGNSDSQEIFISTLKCACNAASRDRLVMGTTPPPHSVYGPEGGMEHVTCCLVEAAICLTSVLKGLQASRVGEA